MPKLINLTGDQANTFELLAKDYEGDVKANTIVPMAFFMANREAVLNAGNVGIWIDSEEQPEELPETAKTLPVIAINFPKFMDGRGYSIARYARERLNFEGELRAIGDVLLDQLSYLKRCGFNAFDMRDDVDTELALSSLGEFTEAYQASNEQPTPLFRRR
ncbi:MAG: DUF934 domain-containing protein [Oleiphilaceae bacterium]|nr:DUF934 domain-containing protein [Oleiphilaceae bacterium]